ncbi:MAG: ORF6N domain-containing protein, partial [Bacilli bacterium]|nr:ORF6N domain-containing protein [Bacilli bacterium]
TKEEILRSQFATSSSWGGRRYLPYVYTEQGIIALAGALLIVDTIFLYTGEGAHEIIKSAKRKPYMG